MKEFGRARQEKFIMWLVFPLLLLWSLTFIYLFIWAFLNSLKEIPEYYANSFALPNKWLFSNWKAAFESLEVPKSNPLYRANLWDMLINSLWYTLGGSLLSIMSAACLSYAVSKYRFKFCGFLYNLTIVVMMFPVMGAMAAEFKYYHLWGIANSPLFLVTALGSIGNSTFLILYAAFKSIPWTYAESVFVEGGGNWTAFLRVMIPQAMPMLTAMFIMTCIGRWNDYMTPYLYLSDYPTLAMGLFRLENASLTINNKPVYFAAVLISVIPIFMLFVLFSQKIMANVSIGGLKG